MKKLSFGIKAESYTTIDDNDFEVYDQIAGEGGPYGKNYFSRKENMPNPNLDPSLRITSIPSPYARMHLTDLAFEELFMLGLDKGSLSYDYQKAISHCLDMFELFFRFDKLDILEKGIKIERIELVSERFGNVTKWKNFLDDNKDVKKYIETLDIFRQQYLNILSQAGNANFKFGFTDMYVFKTREGKTFGSTSPFTGFYTTSNCDLAKWNIECNQHKLLTANPQDWQMLKERDEDFQKFMYVLLNPKNEGGLGNVFANLFSVVEKTIAINKRATSYDNLKFSETYPEYNFTNNDLPKIKTADGSKRYLRSSDLDRSYLKYQLFFKQETPIDFAIKKELYDVAIEKRKFPDGSNVQCSWMGVNDFLSDALFVLPYEISDDYVGLYYEDENGQKHKRCLIPIKAEALRYFAPFNQQYANDRISIRKYADGHFSVSLKIDIQDGAQTQTQITIRREYWPKNYDDKLRIKGRVYEPSELDNFAFGIYPFVKSPTEINIYKVLFYNQLKGKISDESLNVKFYFRDQQQNLNHYISERERQNNALGTNGGANNATCIYNYTAEYDPQKSDSMNTIYFNLESDEKGCGIEFAEISIQDENTTKTNRISGTALIIPILPEPIYQGTGSQNDETLIAIDLGTSNTYIAYKHGSNANSEINMVDKQGKAELRFMHQKTLPNSFTLNPRYEHDLCIQPSSESVENKDNKGIRDCWLKNIPTQLCEFMPTHIMDNSPQNYNKAFTFPIPTLISDLTFHANPNANPTDDIDKNRPLIHSTIPFAYYDIGKRAQDKTPKGNFKWLISPRGTFKSSENEKSLNLFISELLFIVRSHMLYRAFDLSRCKIIWTFPLAFSYDDTNRLTDRTEEIWQKQYLRYFQTDGTSVLNNPKNYTKEVEGKTFGIDKFVLKTNESLSPFYYKQNAQNAYQLLIDIGGGSTDVIGYDSGTIKFISSFEFAGNDLYLKKERQDGPMPLEDDFNIVVKLFNELCQRYKDELNKSDFDNCVRINNTEDINLLMNYGFQKYPNNFRDLWLGDNGLQFLLEFHIGAIFYQTLQLSNNFYKGEMPIYIRLTGNGSKLVELLPQKKKERLKKGIIAHVLQKKLDEIETELSTVSNPKFAAAQGCLNGFDKISNPQNISDVTNNSWIALGDGSIFKNVLDNKVTVEADNKKCQELVFSNVQNYIDLIYSIHDGERLPIAKDYLMSYFENETKKDPNITINNRFSNLFFQCISSLMNGISSKLCEKNK